MKKSLKDRQGFTLVELLIVIVIIGILAAITVVAYNGIQDKAKNTQFLAAFDAYEKVLVMYYTQNDTYPATLDPVTGASTTTPSTAQYACLGSGYTSTSDLPANQCYTASGTVFAAVNPSVNTAFSSIITNQPSIDSATSYNNSDTGEKARGILYYSVTNSGTSTAQLLYVISSDQPCGRGTKMQIPLPNGKTATRCGITYINGAKS